MTPETQMQLLENFLQQYLPREIRPDETTSQTVIRLLFATIPTPKFRFSARVLYTDGIGPRFLDLAAIEAADMNAAEAVAAEQANAALGEGKWKEIKVRPIFSHQSST